MQAVRLTKEEMGDRDGLRYVENPAGEQLLLSGGEAAQAHWPAPMVPSIKTSPIVKSYGRDNDHNHDHEHHEHQHNDFEHHHKTSVLARVKEKAKKWRLSLLRKKHIHEDEGIKTPPTPSTATTSIIPTPAISFDDEDRSIEQDPEYHGAPMYESEMAPKMYKERASHVLAAVPRPKTPTAVLDRGPATTAIEMHPPLPVHDAHKAADLQHQAAVASLKAPSSTTNHPQARNVAVPQPPQAHDSHKEPKLQRLDSFKKRSTGENLIAPATAHTLVTETKAKTEDAGNSNISGGNNKMLIETVTEILAPAYNMVSDATSKIAATIHSPRDESGAKMIWDKGASVKEYLLQKLEPGEEERALSEVITEVISPKKAGPGQAEEKGVVEKVRGTVSSLLGNEEQTHARQVQITAGPHQMSSRPLFKDTQGASILVSACKDGNSILASKATCEASIAASKDTHEATIPSSGYTHGALIVESKHTDGAWNPFSEDGQEVLRASDYTHEASIPASKGVLMEPQPMHLNIHTEHRTLIPASDHTRAISILNSTHSPGDSSPLPVSTHPSFSTTTTNSSPILFSANPSLVNVPTSTSTTFQSSMNPHAEVGGSNGRRLQDTPTEDK